MSICAWSGCAVMIASPWAVTDGGLIRVSSCAWTLDTNKRKLMIVVFSFMLASSLKDV